MRTAFSNPQSLHVASPTLSRWKVRAHLALATTASLALLGSSASASQVIPLAPNAPADLHIPATFAQQFQTLESQGAKFDTSDAALGSAVNPTAADVQRDFARLGWTHLPAPSVLKDPIVREFLAVANSPGATVAPPQISQIEGQENVPPAAPNTAPATPPSGPTPAPPSPGAVAASVHHKGAQAHRANVLVFYAIGCQSSLIAEDAGPPYAVVSYAWGVWSCVGGTVRAADEFEWLSSATGHPLTWFDTALGAFETSAIVDLWFSMPPSPGGADESWSTGGAVGARTAWWWNELCSYTCVAGAGAISWL